MGQAGGTGPINQAESWRAAVDKTTAVDKILDRIRDRGGRVTPVARRVVEIVVEHPEHHYRPSDFIQQASDVEPVIDSTVYRTLDRLVAYGIFTRSHLGDGAVRYHLGTLAHEHLVCDECGCIIDAPAHLLDDAAEQVRASHGFVLHIGASSLHGTCADCRRSLASR